jgi:hypothetical protein
MSEEELDTHTIIAPVKIGKTEGFLVDALHQEDFRKLLFDKYRSSKRYKSFKLIFHKGLNLRTKNINLPNLWEWSKATLLLFIIMPLF